MVMLLVVLWLLWRAFLPCIADWACGCFYGRRARCACRVAITKARETNWARLHVVARNTSKLRNHERLRSLVHLGAHLCYSLRGV